MTHSVIGKMTIGWQARFDDAGSRAYIKGGWTDTNKRLMKSGSKIDIHSTIPSSYRHRWMALNLPVSTDGHKSETSIRTFIGSELALFNGDANTQYLLTLQQTEPSQVTYLYYDNARECIHSYLLHWQEKADLANESDWIWDHSVAGKGTSTVGIFAQLSWATPL